MDNNRITYLYNQYLTKSLSPSELEAFRLALRDPHNDTHFASLLGGRWDGLQEENFFNVPDVIDSRLFNNVVKHQQASVKRSVKLWPRIAIGAAVATIIFGAGLFYYNVNTSREQLNHTAYKNEITPGKTGATLTLANGKKIRLLDASNGKIAQEAGISVTKTVDGQLVYEVKSSLPEPGKLAYNTLSTSNGETYKVRLPDGSLVYLNAASSLTYATSLVEQGKRLVRLRGEGYFEIAKDKAHPFIVESNNQRVEVLGTHFNVNAYSDEPVIKTTLLEGSVQVSYKSAKGGASSQSLMRNPVLLSPGQQSVFSYKGLKVSNVDTGIAIAWKNNQFSFESEDIQTLMRMVARWYNVDVEYTGEITDEKFGGGVSRFDSISKVLKSLESTGKVRFKLEGKKVYVLQP